MHRSIQELGIDRLSVADRIALKRFPYCIDFRLRDDTVVVLSIFHTSRNPESWKRRN